VPKIPALDLYRELEVDPAAPEYIQTVWGAGYRFNDSRAYNYIAKLTFLITPNQNVSLSVSGLP